jgi:AcrR family transcriptional regulator
MTHKPKKKSFREIRYEEMKQAIIKSASKAFGRKGYHAATIEDITNELKMTKGSLYYYFSSKEELLYNAHVLSLEKVLQNILKINATNDPPDTKLTTAITKHLKVFANDFEGAFLLQYEFQLPDEYLDKIIAMRDNYQNNFIQIIEEGIQAGIFKARSARMAAFIILGSINWFLRWYSSDGSWSVDEISAAYVDLFSNGLLTT